MLSEWLMLLAPAVGLSVDVAAQIALFRGCRAIGLLRSEFGGFIAGAAATAALSWRAAMARPLPSTEGIAFLVANLAIFAALGYGYFHFVNLGETARRVRILRELAAAGGTLTREELFRRYNGAEIVRIRLERLLATGQIVLRNGCYCIGNHTLLRMARLIQLMKLLLLGKRSEFD
jgi:hypothetical protein